MDCGVKDFFNKPPIKNNVAIKKSKRAIFFFITYKFKVYNELSTTKQTVDGKYFES